MDRPHHAMLIIGAYTDGLQFLDARDRTADADTLHLIHEQFGIADARALRTQAYLRPTVRGERVFVIAFERGTVEAQNALLKLFEEPPDHVRFYVIVPHKDTCIPTLRSRLQHVGEAKTEPEASAEAFLKMSYRERLEEVTARTKAGDRLWCTSLLTGLEAWAAAIDLKHTILRDIVVIRQYDRMRGASLKILLEHLALSLPVVQTS